MRVRAYRPEDARELADMYGLQNDQGELGYELTDLNSPLWFLKLVVEDEQGKILMATLTRLTCEVHVLIDHKKGTARSRWFNFLGLHALTERMLRATGVDDGFCVLDRTPALNRFARRLVKLGWRPVRALWLQAED